MTVFDFERIIFMTRPNRLLRTEQQRDQNRRAQPASSSDRAPLHLLRAALIPRLRPAIARRRRRPYWSTSARRKRAVVLAGPELVGQAVRHLVRRLRLLRRRSPRGPALAGRRALAATPRNRPPPRLALRRRRRRRRAAAAVVTSIGPPPAYRREGMALPLPGRLLAIRPADDSARARACPRNPAAAAGGRSESPNPASRRRLRGPPSELMRRPAARVL
jgi:hypothetical protein